MKKEKLAEFPQFDTNPWITVNQETGKYEVQLNSIKTTITNLSEASSLLSYDSDDSGKIYMSREQVSKHDFLKIYTSTIAAVLRMSEPTVKLFNYILMNIQFNEPRIYINYNKAMQALNYKHHAAIFRGIKELINLQILARTSDSREYFINPAMVHKGNKFVIVNAFETLPDPLEILPPELS